MFLDVLSIYILCMIIFLSYLYFSIDKQRGKMNDSLHHYLFYIPRSLYQYKLPKHTIHDQKSFITIYKSCIQDIPKQYLFMIRQSKMMCSIIEEKNKIMSLLNLNFECKMSTHNLENKFTFTINHWIVFNETTLQKMYLKWKKGDDMMSFVELMLHEKIHILQRNIQNRFDEMYPIWYPYVNHCLSIQDCPLWIQRHHMLNPDTNLSLWTYVIDNKVYYPYFCKIKHLELAHHPSHKKPILLSSILKQDLRYGLHHPNETFAVQVSQSLTGNKHLNYRALVRFLQSLE